MKNKNIKVCIIRVGGTSCDVETARAFQELGAQTEIKHVNELVKQDSLLDYNLLVFPGGSSFGDHIRSGVVFARTLYAKLGKQIEQFIAENRPILGISNGFQTLIEYGLLPGFEGIGQQQPQAVLTTNNPQGFKCQWVYLKNENKGNCLFTNQIPQDKILKIPIAHSEGCFLFPPGKEKSLLQKLVDNDMLVLRYCNENGAFANQTYPANPNGAYHDIAGICNKEGTIFGLMPHPERAMYWWQEPDWTTKTHTTPYGDGKLIFENILNNIILTQKQ
ncbi:MAG: phosphoribosylformylglycinamidine synthase I [Candidatus Bathyarchaeota archaeon]|nr:phosphoribosylformylglycinamidine synthase I [Candidatus Termiticorpusculum sp.]